MYDDDDDDDEEEFIPNRSFRPMSMVEHRELAQELDVMHRRLIDLSDELCARYRYPNDVFGMSCDAVDAVGWLQLTLDDQSIRDDPENADHCYCASWSSPLLWPDSEYRRDT